MGAAMINKCQSWVDNLPLESFRLPSDGRKWKQAARSRYALLHKLAAKANGDGTFIGQKTKVAGINFSPTWKQLTRHYNKSTLDYLLNQLRKLGYLTWAREQNHHGRRIYTITNPTDKLPPDVNDPFRDVPEQVQYSTEQVANSDEEQVQHSHEQVQHSPESGSTFEGTGSPSSPNPSLGRPPLDYPPPPHPSESKTEVGDSEKPKAADKKKYPNPTAEDIQYVLSAFQGQLKKELPRDVAESLFKVKQCRPMAIRIAVDQWLAFRQKGFVDLKYPENFIAAELFSRDPETHEYLYYERDAMTWQEQQNHLELCRQEYQWEDVERQIETRTLDEVEEPIPVGANREILF
jgi:hypothetical protein